MHIDVDKLTGDIPYKPIHYLDPGISQKRLNPEQIVSKLRDHYANICSSAID